MIDTEKNWLSEEIKRESRISAWDLDEPNKIRAMHETNCPRQKLAEEHIEVHEGQIQKENFQEKPVNYSNHQQQKLLSFIMTIIIMIFLLSLLMAMFE